MLLRTRKTLTNVSVGLFFLESLDADKSFYGLTFSAFCISGLVAGPVYGVVTDRLRKTKAAVLFANLFEIGGNLMYMWGKSKYIVLGGRLVAGIGMGAGSSIMAQLAWTSTESERTAVFSVAMAMRNLGLMLGPAFNVFLREFDFTWGPFRVDRFTSAGMFMSGLWIVVEIVILVLYSDLPSIHAEPRLQIQTEPVDDAQSGKLDFAKEYLREEIVVLLGIQFMLLFNQCSMELLVVPTSTKYFFWNEIDNSVFYSAAAIGGVAGFIGVRYLSRFVGDRWLIVVGMTCEAVAVALLLGYLPTMRVGVHTKLDMGIFMLGCAIVVVGLPFFIVGNASLFSKLTRMKFQGLSQGLRRMFTNLGIIMGPLWAGAWLDRPYVMLGVMLGLQVLFLGMLVASFGRLQEPRFRKRADEGEERETEPLIAGGDT